MGILEQVVGGLLGGGGGNAGGSPMQSVLMGLLGGQQGGQSGGVGGMLGGAGGAGGLQGLLGAFEQAGLGHIAQSWVGNGANQPVSPDQLQSVLGQDKVQGMAQQAGLSPGDLLKELAQHLPQAVDGMTPNGRVEPETLSV